MSISTFNNVEIIGIAGTAPKGIVSNLNDHPNVSQDEKEKIIQLTGISEYRKSTKEVCSSDLCQRSAETLFSEMRFSFTLTFVGKYMLCYIYPKGKYIKGFIDFFHLYGGCNFNIFVVFKEQT